MALGELEQLILMTLLRLGSQGHGVAIAQELESRTGRVVAPGALYTVLDRLQVKGYVEGWIGDATPERGGRRRKVYRLLPAGVQAVRSWYASVQDLAEGVPSLSDIVVEGPR